MKRLVICGTIILGYLYPESSLRSEDNMIDNSFRHSAGFGKRMEYKIVGDMLMEGLDCYMPLVDDHGVDCVIKRGDGVFIEIFFLLKKTLIRFAI